MQGFSLIEMMIALLVLTFGLLSAGQMLFVAASSGSLARSKSAAAIAAQSKLESLAALYQQDPLALDLAAGYHGPVQVNLLNPADASTLNLFRIEWNISPVPDPRPGMALDGKLVKVTVIPSLPGGRPNNRPRFNKILSVSTIISPRTR